MRFMSVLGDGVRRIAVEHERLSARREALGQRFTLQGNLDPCALFAPEDVLRRRVRQVLERGHGLPGHVFNLGHGILPGTPVERVEALVDEVRQVARPA